MFLFPFVRLHTEDNARHNWQKCNKKEETRITANLSLQSLLFNNVKEIRSFVVLNCVVLLCKSYWLIRTTLP